MKKSIFLEKMETKHPDMFSFYDYSNLPDRFLRSEKLEIKCPTHGFFKQCINDHLNGSGCSECKISRQRNSLKTFIVKAREKHGERYDYSKSVYTTREANVVIGCSDHGFFEQLAKSHLKGSGCPKCYGNAKDDIDSFKTKARSIHGHFYDYSEAIYISSKDKVDIKCPNHGIFLQSPNGHLQGLGCPRCKESKGETEIKSFLDSFKIPHVQEYKFEGTSYRYDFCLPSQKILIEFHGIQHYEAVEWFGGEESFREQISRDAEKIELASSKGFRLIILNHRQLKAGVLSQSVAKELKYIFKFWCRKSSDLLVFKDSRELATFFNLSYTPLDRIMADKLVRSYPEVKILF